MSQFKRFNASESGNYNSSNAYPEGTLTWDPSNGLRIHDGSTSGGNAVSASTGYTRFLGSGIGSYDTNNSTSYNMTISPNWDGDFTGNAYITLPSNENFGSPLQIVQNSTGGVQIITQNDAAWAFGADGNLTLPVNGDIKDRDGNSVLGGGGGTTLPADASGYLNNNGSGTLTWVPGNPSGSGMLPYNGVTVLSNTVVGDWTEYTLSGTMDAFYDWNNTYTTITLSSETAYGKQITPNTKNLWINDSKINNTNYLVIEFPASPAVGDVFSVPVVNTLTTVNAGSFVVGETYTIVSAGTTNWTSIGAQYGGSGQSFVATDVGSGTGTATTSAGAKKLIFKPASGHRAQTMAQGNLGPTVFGQGGTYDFMYVDLSGLNSGNPITWVYAGLVDSIPTWYQFYF